MIRWLNFCPTSYYNSLSYFNYILFMININVFITYILEWKVCRWATRTKEKEEDTKDISINLCPLSSYELIIHDLYFQSLIFYLLIFLYHMVFIMCPSCLSLILLLFIFTFHAFFISFINKTNTAIFDEG